MLKIITPTANIGCNFSKSKCAEIHYHSSTFSILCIFCGMKTLAFTEFCNHFHNHYDTFINAWADKEETLINSESEITENFNGKHDPLKLEVGDGTKDSEELLNILRSEKKETSKEGGITDVSNYDETVSDHDFGRHQTEHASDASDTELFRTIIKLEGTVVSCKGSTNLANSTTKVSPTPKCTSDEDENFANDVSAEVFVEKIDENITESIDWSKSYEPNLLKNSDKRPYKTRNTPNKCTYCGKTFRRRLQLDTHLNIHTGSKPHQCEICGRLFRAVTTLARHLNTHEDREVFNCKFCAKSFSRRAALLSHELRHTQQRRIPCDECEKLFYTVNQMDTHKRKVHNKADDASLPFQCNLCTKRYRSASMLSTHKFKKHYKTAKITCEKCGKKFVNDQQLEVHKAIHVCNVSRDN